jgi:hypothetical protein
MRTTPITATRNGTGRLRHAVAVALCGLSALGMVAATGCGDDQKKVTASDRAAFDRFADGARQWRRQGSDPWLKAFNDGGGQLAVVAPTVEAKMQASINKMSSAANDISEPTVRKSLQRLVGTYRAKLAAIKGIDSERYSLARIRQGLDELKSAGVATKKAWESYVSKAKKTWNANPLAGLNVG